jgi:hypothetical protein
MPGPFDKPPMTQQQFITELQNRGFRFCPNRKIWVGPFGITVTGVANQANFHTESGMFNPQGIGNAGLTGGGIGPGVSGLRKSLLADVDEQLRSKRGQPRAAFRPAYDPPNSPPPVH